MKALQQLKKMANGALLIKLAKSSAHVNGRASVPFPMVSRLLSKMENMVISISLATLLFPVIGIIDLGMLSLTNSQQSVMKTAKKVVLTLWANWLFLVNTNQCIIAKDISHS